MSPCQASYELKVRRCTIHAGRYRWDILENGRPLQSSTDSFPTRKEAQKAGLIEMRRLTVRPSGSADHR
jgi:hypothetical protein